MARNFRSIHDSSPTPNWPGGELIAEARAVARQAAVNEMRDLIEAIPVWKRKVGARFDFETENRGVEEYRKDVLNILRNFNGGVG